jgi:apolipoprotein N-acyltransferase
MVTSLTIALYVIVSCSLLSLLILTTHKETTKKVIVFRFFLFGFVYNAFTFLWLFATYPLAWLREGYVQILGISLLWVILSIMCGLSFAIVALLYKRGRVSRELLPFYYGILIVLAEGLRALFISTLYYTKENTIDLHFTTGMIGHALAVTPLVELAYYGGPFMLSFVGTILITTVLTQNKKVTTCYGFFILLFFLYVHNVPPIQHVKREAFVITTNIHTKEEDTSLVDRVRGDIYTTTLALATSTFLVALPEDTRLLASLSDKELSMLKKKLPNTAIIDGDTLYDENQLINVSRFLLPNNEKQLFRPKTFLMAFNEYIPLVLHAPFMYFAPQNEAYTNYIKHHTYGRRDSTKTILIDDIRVATLICSEMVSYRTVADLAKEKPNIVIYQSRLEVFHHNPTFMAQMYLFTKIGAAQLRAPILSTKNSAPSYLISGRGEVLQTWKPGEQGYVSLP